ncbi:hypothetical protein GWI33_000984, partial [Rhynchophorus ferrugineus]
MLVEFIGGYLTNSLALLSDAGHMLSDSVALGIALAAVYIGEKSSNTRKSFGYQRFEILAAAVNGLALIAISLYIFVEAIIRFQHPQAIHVEGMLIVACMGLFINIIVALMMFKGSDTEHDLNMRSAFLHVLSDLLGSVGAIVAALCLWFFDWAWADPLTSILVSILVLRGGIQITLKSSHVLMEGTPDQFSPEQIQQEIQSHTEVLEVHDLHIWSLNSKRYILSCHIVVSDQMQMSEVQDLLHILEHQMQDLGIEHVTIQTETRSSIILVTGCASLGPHGGSVDKRASKLSLGLQQAYAVSENTANRLSPLIIRSADRYEVDPRLISAIIRQESNFNSNARSPTGAVGLGQIIPSYWANICGTDLYNESTNINCTAHILSSYYQQGGSWKKAIAYYNVGPTGYESSFWTRWKV